MHASGWFTQAVCDNAKPAIFKPAEPELQEEGEDEGDTEEVIPADDEPPPLFDLPPETNSDKSVRIGIGLYLVLVFSRGSFYKASHS